LNLREELRRVLIHPVELSAHVIDEIGESLVDVRLPGEARGLILLLPRLDVDDAQSRIQRILEVLRGKKGEGSIVLP